jgi:hypothetical protein
MDYWKGRWLMAALDAPHIFINEYMKDKIVEFGLGGVPFYPTMPSNLDTVGEIQLYTETAGTVSSDGSKMAVYDRMFKLRRQAFPVLKYEQLLYYFYSYGQDDLQKLQQQAQDLLDWGDESAKQINAWIQAVWKNKGGTYDPTSGRPIVYFGETAPESTNDWFALPFFHEIKVFQLEESRDIVDFGSARTFAGNKLIVDYCWHA